MLSLFLNISSIKKCSEVFPEQIFPTAFAFISLAATLLRTLNSEYKHHGYEVNMSCFIFSSVQFSCSVLSYSWLPHGLQHTSLPCPSPTPRNCSNSCPSSWWCHPTISSTVIPFSSCLQSFLTSEYFPKSQFFASGGQHIGASVSTSVLPMNIQNWSPLGWTSWITLQSMGFSTVFSNTTVQNHQFFGTQLFLQSDSHIHSWLLEKP